MEIRLATAEDAAACAAIYAPHVATPTSFEEAAPDAGEMARRIAAAHVWVVAQDGGAVCGFAYAGAHRARAAYRWSAETSVYLEEAARGRGVATALYADLLGRLADAGFHTALAGITLPNPASVTLHERHGFEPVGVFRSVGFKCGAWHDVGWWQRAL